MIQEISPHRFHNEFYLKSPRSDSYFFYFKDDSLVLNHENTLAIPQYSDLGELCPGIFDDVYASTFLFSIDKREYFLIDQSRIPLPSHSVNEKLQFYKTSVIRDMEPMREAFAAANGHEMYRFYQNNAYCGRCGHPLEKSPRERAMVCPSCKNTVYPKLAPAVIVAVTWEDKLLLTKYASGTYNRYALVAGYTEFGETLEDTVRREVMEEVGLHVKNIRYYKNQPWAFSDSLLVGFFCELDGSPQIHLDRNELSTAVWLKKEDIPGNYTNISLTHEMILLFKNSF